MTEIEQINLVNAALSGDLAAFGCLCDKYYSPMVALAYCVLYDHHLAEDAAQETFARALQNLRKLSDKEKFASWLARICRNVAVDLARFRSRDTKGDFSIATQDFPSPAAPANDNCEITAVREVISRLPAAERELIVLRYYNSMSFEAMADVLGLSKTVINTRLCRARKRIAQLLRNKGISEVLL